MFAKIWAGTNIGLDAVPVVVETDISSGGLPNFFIVGLADRAVEEAKERVRSALKNSGADFPPRRITVNLAPADLPKIGPVFDLAIAVGLLVASGQLEADLSEMMLLGELSLDGSLRPVNGILSLALMAKKQGIKKILVPRENAKEAAVVEGVEVYPFGSLAEVFSYLINQVEVIPQERTEITLEEEIAFEYDFSLIKGQEQAKRALEIAAAGAHNILMKGPPGTGKTLLARSFPSILPQLSLEESIEVTKIYSITGKLSHESPLIKRRPFRAPHHTASFAGMIGGGNSIRPGEISLAHRGVLFTDELPEFQRNVLEALRQPLEDHQVVISRSSGSIQFPAQFILVATQNPCPCGYLGVRNKNCLCSSVQITRYKKRISGPLLDRIDIHLDVPAVDLDKLTGEYVGEDSKTVKVRVDRAREIQRKRFQSYGILTNSEMTNIQVKEFCQLTDDAKELLKLAVVQMGLSARSYTRVLKVGRTIADLAESEVIKMEHIAEALQYRAREDS